MQILIQTSKQVWLYTLAVSAIAIAVPVIVVGGLMSAIPQMPFIAILFGVTLAFLIPLLIAPPLSFLMISMLKQQTETIQRVDEHVRYDMLTGALNRSHFLDSVRGRKSSGILMIVDADHFKQVNDTRGHAAGDEALCILVRALSDTVAPKGIVGRMGGEEFGVFLPATDLQDGARMADRLCRNIEALDMIVGGKLLKMTVSIGVMLHKQSYTIGHSMKIADERLYIAKNAGRNRYVISDTADLTMAQSA
jgi:diguanylate cyclase